MSELVTSSVVFARQRAGSDANYDLRTAAPETKGAHPATKLATMLVGLEALTAAVLLLDRAGRMVFANDKAAEMLRRADAIRLGPTGILRCTDRTAGQTFQRAIAAVLMPDAAGKDNTMQALAIPRADGWPLGALVCRHDDGLLPAGSGRSVDGGRIVVLIRDPEQALDGYANRIATIFSLSRAEAQVVERLVAGAGLQQIAADRGVSLVTVRNQVKAAQAKTGVLRQAELVSLVLRTVPF